MKMPERNYATLDALTVIGSLCIVAGVLVGLFTHPLEAAVAPIVSALATAVLGLAGAYGAFRWGSSVGTNKTPAPHDAQTAADQVAGAADAEASRIKDPGT